MLHIASWFPNDDDPMNGDFILRHIEAIHRSQPKTKHKVICLWEGHHGFEIDKREMPFGEILYVRCQLPKIAPLRFFKKRSIYRKVADMINRQYERPLLIHHHVMYDALLLTLILSKSWNINGVITEHYGGYYLPKPSLSLKIKKKYVSYLFNTLRGKWTLSPVSLGMLDALKRINIEGPSHVVRNVVPDYFMNPDHKTKTRYESVPTLLHVSSLIEEYKNIEGMLQGIKTAVDKGAKFKVSIIGSNNFETIQKMIEDQDLSAFVSLEGPLEHEEIARRMQLAKGFVMFSVEENAPCVLSEANCAGIPSICTDVGGCKELIDSEKLGIVIPPRDIEALAEAIINLLSKDYNKLEIQEIGKSRYSQEVIGSAYWEIYGGLV